MAKYFFKNGKLVISGKVGGLVFSKDGRVRSLMKRTGAVSAGQESTRNRFKEAVMLWDSLPAVEKDAWHSRARGFKGKLRGFFAFMSAQLKQDRRRKEPTAKGKTRLR